jgi:hypothetical protein
MKPTTIYSNLNNMMNNFGENELIMGKGRDFSQLGTLYLETFNVVALIDK